MEYVEWKVQNVTSKNTSWNLTPVLDLKLIFLLPFDPLPLESLAL